jgi:hypothetical protein
MSIIPETYGFSETRISFGISKKDIKELAVNIHNHLITDKKYAKI